MFEGLVTRAQRSVDTLVSKYVTRLIVAVPFLVAFGFGTAAASVKLTAEYGSTVAHAIMAATFAGLGLVAAITIALSGSRAAPASPEQAGSTQQEAATGVEQKEGGLTPELLLTVLGAVGPAAISPLFRLVVRNLPVVLLALLLGYVLFSERKLTDSVAAE
jgi:hypothetical protein